MTVFGIIWFVVAFLCFLKKDIKYILFITLLFMTFQCSNVIYIGTFGIGPGVITSILFSIKVLFHERLRFHLIKKDRAVISLSLFLLSIVIISSLLNGIFNRNFMVVMQLAAYILCFICINLIKTQLNRDELYKMIRWIIKFVSIFGIIQYLTTTEIIPLRKPLELLFYNDLSTDVVFHKLHYSRIMSTFMEPSYFAGFIVGSFYYLLNYDSKWRENVWILFLILIEIIMTRSSTAYGAFFIVGIFFFLFAKNINIKWKSVGLLIALIGFIVVYTGFYDILDTVVFSKDTTGSFSTRTRWNIESLKVFKSSKIYGIGYKNIRGSSIIYSLLAQLGIIGLFVYLLFNFIICAPLFNKLRRTAIIDFHSNGLRFGVLAVVICQMIACPDLDLCTYWFWLYCTATMLPSNKIKVLNNKKVR